MAKDDREKYSDKEVPCDFCPSKLGYMYTVETEDAWQIIACCRTCKLNKVPEDKVWNFKKWLWPKDAATIRAEQEELKKAKKEAKGVTKE